MIARLRERDRPTLLLSSEHAMVAWRKRLAMDMQRTQLAMQRTQLCMSLTRVMSLINPVHRTLLTTSKLRRIPSALIHRKLSSKPNAQCSALRTHQAARCHACPKEEGPPKTQERPCRRLSRSSLQTRRRRSSRLCASRWPHPTLMARGGDWPCATAGAFRAIL